MSQKAIAISPPTLYDEKFAEENRKLSNVSKIQRISITDSTTPISPRTQLMNGPPSEMIESHSKSTQPQVESSAETSTQVNMMFVMPP